MFDDLTRNLRIANEALARYYETRDPFDEVIYRFSVVPLAAMLLDAEKLPDYVPPEVSTKEPSEP